MAQGYDTIIIGLGAMGSAAAYQLARRGQRVLGLERYTPGHTHGSSHGRSRIIRQAYFEGAAYVPLLLRAYELWRELERESGEDIMRLTGGLMIGQPAHITVAGALVSAQQHGLPYELLDAAALRRRYPMLQPDASTVALYEQNAGVLRPEAAIQAYLRLAAARGAELRFEQPALSWRADARGVQVTTGRGNYEAAQLIIAPGAWAPQLLAELALPLVVERQVLYWFAPKGGYAAYQPDRFPIFIWEIEDHMQFYGFPAEQHAPFGVKTAFFRNGEACTAETCDRVVRPDEVAGIRAAIDRLIPDLGGELIAAQTCLYTTTPDEHFILAKHPHHANVTVASPCSGHGFKFASAIGEVLADLASEGATKQPIGLFDPRRFGTFTAENAESADSYN
ncbi:MAG: N-methyl-L-tryptophan oxidase [Roseiflexaceae bacterium]|nr:N-methyl-L-tryptophan oxidase [Roseiflexaceae bacterium]